MRRIKAFALIFTLSLTLFVKPTFAEVTIDFNDSLSALKCDTITDNGTTLVPARAILERLGANVRWEADTQKITAVIGAEYVVFEIGSKAAYSGTTLNLLATEPRLVSGVAMIPLRFAAEHLGYSVSWNSESKTITLEPVSYSGMPGVPDLGKVAGVEALNGSGNKLYSTDGDVTVSYSYKGISDKSLEAYKKLLLSVGFTDLKDKNLYLAAAKDNTYVLSVKKGNITTVTISVFE
jgi:hypothetical protein